MASFFVDLEVCCFFAPSLEMCFGGHCDVDDVAPRLIQGVALGL